MTTVLASSALCPPGDPSPGWVAFDDGIIVEVGAGEAPRGATDLGDAILTPGFVDLQCNGIDEVDFASADADGWRRGRAQLRAHGVTSFCPTFVSAPTDRYDAMLDAVAIEQSRGDALGAAVIGAHLEGPFLGGAPGAHDPAHVRSLDLDAIDRFVQAWPGALRVVTLAPEADPGFRGIRALVAAGVVVALGHSTASYDDAVRAADAGASIVTHLYNAMSAFQHRAPGLVGAALTDARLTPTLIADLVHLHPAALRIAFACKPHSAVVSDSVARTDAVVARNGAAWLADGTLAGSTRPLDAALGNLTACGLTIRQAIEAVTASPARLVGATDRGRLEAGTRADLVALDPETLAVGGVWVAGRPHADIVAR